MKRINIALLGCGTVGTGVARLLYNNRDILRSRTGADLVLKYVADIDLETDRGIPFEKGILIPDAKKAVDDPEVDIAVEMIGGTGIAKELILRAIENRKHVVTANKALLAEQGREIFEAADEHGVDVAFEASVGGCMPVVKTLRESLVGDRILSMTGILNGTSNYILSKITDEGISFHQALEMAQKSGYAEADPTLDIEGIDAAHKIAIISSLAYGSRVDFSEVFIEGISRITPLDILFADQFGYRIKLLAISKKTDDAMDIRVHPAMVPFNKLLSNVNGTVNALNIFSEAAGDILLYGRGAGMMPTAAAVVSDIVDLARNILKESSKRVPMLAFQPGSIRNIPLMPIEEISAPYYLRFSALDRPGVLSKLSGVLGENSISIKEVHQKGRKLNGSVPVVMLTHIAREASIKRALSAISLLDIISDKPTLIRIEDPDYEKESR